MKIYGKQVFVGSKKMCMEYTSKILGGFSDAYVGANEYNGDDMEHDVIFIQDKNGYFVDINDIDGSGFLALRCYGAVPRYHNCPRNAGDIYVGDLKPYFDETLWETKFNIKDLVQSFKNTSTYTID